jgi:hypothetical protein
MCLGLKTPYVLTLPLQEYLVKLAAAVGFAEPVAA